MIQKSDATSLAHVVQERSIRSATASTPNDRSNGTNATCWTYFKSPLSSEITSTNPVVHAIIGGTAPQPARLAAARGMLPLPQNDLLEVLVALTQSDDAEIANAAAETLNAEANDDLL